jgi:predicted transcriptional regulator
MRQTNICETSGWSKATVSRTLCEMEDAGQITRIRVGKGKVVCLPDAMPGERSTTDADSSDLGSSEPATGD